MVRVSHPKSGKQAATSNGLRGPKVSKNRNRHKVVFEDVEQKKEKSLYFRSDPPRGYTFIPAGNPQLTEALKDFAKKGNHETFAVTTTPHASRHELSREVHRIGWHFPTEVVAAVCNYYGIRLTASGKLVEDKDDDKLFMKVYQRGQLVLDEKVRDQVTINTEAKQIIKDLFPNIPDNDLFKIIKTAFQVGDGKVGTADEIPLVRRAQLSVVAHIRHTYTNYDKLLRQVPYSEARHSVENKTLKKLILWRGDDEDKTAVEDTLREVVVISDEDDSDEDGEEGQILDNEDVRVQLVSDVARPEYNSEHRPHSPIEQYSADNRSGGYRYVPQVVRRVPVRSQVEVLAAQQRSRYAVWDRYRQEYRTAVAPQPAQVVRRILIEDPVDQSTSILPTTRAVQYESDARRTLGLSMPLDDQPNTPSYIRGTDGRVYERIVRPSANNNPKLPSQGNYSPSLRTADMRNPETYSSSRPYPAQMHSHQRTVSLDDNDGTVVRSIEGSNGVYQSPSSRRHPLDGSHIANQKRYSDGHQTYLQQEMSIDTPRSFNQGSERRHVEPTSPLSVLRKSGREVGEWQRNGSHHYQPTQMQEAQPYVRHSHDIGDPINTPSSQTARQRMVHDSSLNHTMTRTRGNMNPPHTAFSDQYSAPGYHVAGQVHQAHPIQYFDGTNTTTHDPLAPSRMEYDRPILHVNTANMAQKSYHASIPRPASGRTSATESLRYAQVQDGQVPLRSYYYPEEAPARYVQSAQHTPVTMARRVSGQDRDYHMVARTPTTYYQPVSTPTQMSQPRRDEPPLRNTYVQY